MNDQIAQQMLIAWSAPIPFFIAVLALVIPITLFVLYLSKTSIEAKDSQIALWKDRATAWEKTGAGTPEELKRMLARRWPPLSPEEGAALRQTLRNYPRPVLIIIRWTDSDCSELGESLFAFFKSLDWPAQYEEETTRGFLETGLLILQGDGQNHTLADALATATKGRITARTEPQDVASIRIMIGRKPILT
jgi:hypothetical protein